MSIINTSFSRAMPNGILPFAVFLSRTATCVLKAALTRWGRLDHADFPALSAGIGGCCGAVTGSRQHQWERVSRESSVTYPCDAPDKPSNDIVFGAGFRPRMGTPRWLRSDACRRLKSLMRNIRWCSSLAANLSFGISARWRAAPACAARVEKA
jgi:hypothetical protein